MSADLSGSGMGSSPATDETDGSRKNHDQHGLGHGSKSKPHLAGLDKEFRFMSDAASVNCFTKPGSICGASAQPKSDGWTKVRVTVDSGAADSVASPDAFPGYCVVAHPKPEFFQSATGEPIINEGEQRVAMITEEGSARGMKFQCTNKVRKPLASAKRMIEANHAVVFAPESIGGCFLLSLDTGKCNRMHDVDGNYVLDVWVPPAAAMAGFGGQP